MDNLELFFFFASIASGLYILWDALQDRSQK